MEKLSSKPDDRFIGLGSDLRRTRLQRVVEAYALRLRHCIHRYNTLALVDSLWELLHSLIQPREQMPDWFEHTLIDIDWVLQYVHAVASSDGYNENVDLDTSLHPLRELLALTGKLRHRTLAYCALAAGSGRSGELSRDNSELVFQAMTSWLLMRAYRYGALEQDFFELVLQPHDEMLIATYGISASDIAQGIQKITNSLRPPIVENHLEHVQTPEAMFAKAESIYRRRVAAGPIVEASLRNVSVAEFPAALLDDLSFTAGTEREFFSTGPLRGTPLYTFPGRIKPLLALNSGHIACDPYFFRDSTYRAIQRGLNKKSKGGRREWKDRQTAFSEGAFAKIFSRQLHRAQVFTNFEVMDPLTGKYYEQDALILLDDVLLQIEVKGGGMVMHSPDVNFEGYTRTVHQLIVEAYDQCKRFIECASNSEEVQIFKRDSFEKRVEVHRLRLSQYRVVIPIGLTIEAFTPISSNCNRLDDIKPIVSKFPFVSMSIDDLIILNHLFPEADELMHYLTVRQSIAAEENLSLQDEADHVGMYLTFNRVDVLGQVGREFGVENVVVHRPSGIVDRFFSMQDWRNSIVPKQFFPTRVRDLLQSINARHGARFLLASAIIRDLGPEQRLQLDKILGELSGEVKTDRFKSAIMLGVQAVMIRVQQSTYVDIINDYRSRAEILAADSVAGVCKVLVVFVAPDGRFDGAWAAHVNAPSGVKYNELLVDAAATLSGKARLSVG